MTNEERIAEIDSKLDDIIANPQFEYKVGDKTVSHKEYFVFLHEIRQQLLDNQDSNLEIIEFHGLDLDEMGNKK